jgi:ABC-type sugar transport system permease subunit
MVKHKAKMESTTFGVVMLMPAFLIILILQVYPLLTGIVYSFFNFRLDRPQNRSFIGIENFIKVLTTDRHFYRVLAFTFVNAVCVVIFSYVIGLSLSLLMNKRLPGRGLYRALVLLPWIVSSAVVGSCWKWILNDRYGIVNTVLQGLNLVERPIQFFAVPSMARFTVVLVGTWATIPFMCIVLLAGLQSISADLYDAAAIDGAGFWGSFFHVTLPGIAEVTILCTTLQFIWQFNNFETVYLLTMGGPKMETFTLPVYMYNMAFKENRISYSSAIAVQVMVVMLAFAFIRFHFQRKRQEGIY